MTPVGAAMRGRSFIMLSYLWLSFAGAVGRTANILRGPMGFGAAGRIHTAKILRLSMDLPMVIEIVDSEEKVNGFLPDLEKMIGGGLVTLEKIKVLHYRPDKPKPE
jgi:uncharacterized protein